MSDKVTLEFEPVVGTLRPERSVAGRLVIIGLAIIVATALAAGVTGLFSNADEDKLFVAGSVPALRAAGVTFVEAADAYIVATPKGFLALRARSTHMGEHLPFCRTSQWFEEPAHGDKYDREGYYRLGPAPRGLDRYRIRIDNGVVLIDTRVLIKGPPRGTSSGQLPEGPFCVMADS